MNFAPEYSAKRDVSFFVNIVFISFDMIKKSVRGCIFVDKKKEYLRMDSWIGIVTKCLDSSYVVGLSSIQIAIGILM